MTQYQQLTGENIPYQQAITGDVISSVAWSVLPLGPVLSGESSTTTATTIFFLSRSTGEFIVTIALTCASGAIYKNQFRVSVISKLN